MTDDGTKVVRATMKDAEERMRERGEHIEIAVEKFLNSLGEISHTFMVMREMSRDQLLEMYPQVTKQRKEAIHMGCGKGGKKTGGKRP